MPSKKYARDVLRVLRLALLLVLFFWILGAIIAAGRPETGPVEDVVLALGIVGLFALGVPVRRIGASTS